MANALENWETLSMIALRNLSCLARVYFHTESELIKRVGDSYEEASESANQIGDKGQKTSPDNILEWFKDVYLPMRLLERNQNLEKGNEDQSKDGEDKAQTAKLKIWFKIDGSNTT